MTREIKFRIWDKVDYLSEPFTLFDLQSGAIEFTSDCILMQFTGLYDKDRKEIYEGDIVTIPYVDPMGKLHRDTIEKRIAVGFEFGRFILKYPKESKPLTDGCENTEGAYIPNYENTTILSETTVFRVIGNIYENPEQYL